MPFGLTNAPAVFQYLVNDVLQDMLDQFVLYIWKIYSTFLLMSRLIQHVRQVLQPLLDHQLFVKPEKCEFHVPTVSFLGFVI